MVTVNINPEVTEEVRTYLTAAGYGDVHVAVSGGSALGDKAHAPINI